MVGCTGTRGSAANQMRSPRDLKFDRYGNLYVTDQGNHRIQKFMIDVSSSLGCPNSKLIIALIMIKSKSSFISRWKVICILETGSNLRLVEKINRFLFPFVSTGR